MVAIIFSNVFHINIYLFCIFSLQALRKMMAEEKVKGFPTVLISKDVSEGLHAWYVAFLLVSQLVIAPNKMSQRSASFFL